MLPMASAERCRGSKVKCLLASFLLISSGFLLLFFTSDHQSTREFKKSMNDMAVGYRKKINSIGSQLQDLQEKLSFRQQSTNIFDGCYHIYMDVGSNVGVQVRKLYEPELYPEATYPEVFQKTFQSSSGEMNLKEICAVGYEPNPNHSTKLQALEAAYNQCGWRVHFFIETAVSHHKGKTKFFTDGVVGQLEWGGGIVESANNVINSTEKEIKVRKLSDLIMGQIKTRKLPRPLDPDFPPQIVMKLDIEGSEVEVLPDLLMSGSLSVIDKVFIEFHHRLAGNQDRKEQSELWQAVMENIDSLLKRASSDADIKRVDISGLDDETYHVSYRDLPKCER